MVATWLVVYVTHRLGLAIIFVGRGDCPEFLSVSLDRARASRNHFFYL